MTSMLFRLVRTRGSLFKCNYLQKKIFHLNSLLNFWNLHQIWNIFCQKKLVIPTVFPKLQTFKDLIVPLSKKRRFRTSFDSQLVKWSQKLVTYAWEHFYHIFLYVGREIIPKITPLLKFEIIGTFVNTMTADYKCPAPDSKNFRSPFKSNYPKKGNHFLIFFSNYGIYIKF